MGDVVLTKDPVDNVEILSISLVANPAFVPLDEEEKKKFQPAFFHLIKRKGKSNERLTAEILKVALLKEFDIDVSIRIEDVPINKSELAVISKSVGATGWDKASEGSKYHCYRIKDTDVGSTSRTKDFKKGIKATFCQRKDDPKKWDQQNLMFDSEQFTLAEAKAWVRTHKVKSKSVGTEFTLNDMDADVLFIEQKEKWEIAYADFKEMYKQSKFTPSWDVREYCIKYYMSPTDYNTDRVFSVRLVSNSDKSDMGIEFEEAYSAVDKQVRVTTIEFDTTKFTEETAKAWLLQHFKGDVINMDKDEITALVESTVKSVVKSSFVPIEASIVALTDTVKKFQEGITTDEPLVIDTPDQTDVSKQIETAVTPLTKNVAELTTLVQTLTKGRGSALDAQPPALPDSGEQKSPVIPIDGSHHAHVEYDPNDPSSFEIMVKSNKPQLPGPKVDPLMGYIDAKIEERIAAGGGQ